MDLFKSRRRKPDNPSISVSTPSVAVSATDSHPDVNPTEAHPAIGATVEAPTAGVTLREDYQTTIVVSGALTALLQAYRPLDVELFLRNLVL